MIKYYCDLCKIETKELKETYLRFNRELGTDKYNKDITIEHCEKCGENLIKKIKELIQ